MILNFLVPSTPHPVGGSMAIYEFANGMVRRGHDVRLTHVEFFGPRAESLADLGWFEFDPRLNHDFPPELSEAALPDVDFLFCFDERVPTTRGLPLMWVQAFGILGYLEPKIFTAPCPKLCTATWLLGVLAEHGVLEPQRVHMPYGMKHEKYHITTPVEDRPPRVAMLYNSHPVKGAGHGISAIAEVLERLPDADGVLFGTTELVHTLPDRVTFYDRPDQQFLVEKIYNGSSVFVSPSIHEGFGLAALESMACGCVLASTANGGSEDYAFHGETALVSAPRDSETMAANIESVLRDGTARVDLALRGAAYTQRFQWDRSAELLEQFLEAYGANPSYYLER